MLNIQQFRTSIVRPTLESLGAHNRTAENLVIGTALQGNKMQLSNSINALDTESALAVWDTMVAAEVPSHQNKALD